MRRLMFILSAVFLLVACSNTKPQTPANTAEIDTVAQNLLYTNQLLVQQTNTELALYVKHNELPFTQHMFGFWYKFTKRTKNSAIQPDDLVTLHYQVLLLDSTPCMDIITSVHAGKKEVPPAIDYSLCMMNNGEAIDIIAPWYSAYGQKGEDIVPAYTNVIFHVELLDE